MSNANQHLQDLMEKLDLETYLDQEGIEYRPTMGSSGPQFNIKECPACGNSKWKVFLNQATGLGNCFAGSCTQKTFNKFSFIRCHTGLASRKVIEHVEGIVSSMGWRPTKKVEVQRPTAEGLKLPFALSIPGPNGENLTYLANRGIDVATAKRFGLQYCEKALWSVKLDGQTYTQDYSNRVIIPVNDLDGKLVSFQGRDMVGTAEKKYLFPMGFASTGSHLYNGDRVSHGTKRLAVGEGAFDVIAMEMAFSSSPYTADVGVVGTFGKHLSFGHVESQVEKFERLRVERGVEHVTFMWDGEAQALKDAIVAGLILKGRGLQVAIALLPPGKDPNEIPPNDVRVCYLAATPLTYGNAIRMKLQAASIYP